ncbi:sugar kinase [Paenibacillus silvae]|uniref:Sugar kinase n=1 Tax=Paenibacillus silvae TaxID=1325358 RepID=A0ABQ1ZCT0_9BACL|nr:sugar kinase [Paenibacillus silvae]GGH58749.1 sugar kinase [Paenibacillus silvae]
MFGLDESIKLERRSNDLLAIGELLVDMISNEYGDHAGSDGYTRFFGGAPSNIAINVKRLGIRSRIASAVGEDGFGTFLLSRLQQAGMDTDGIKRVGEATSMVVVSKSKSTPIPIFYRAADFQLTVDEALTKWLRDSSIVHFSCWPLSRQPARATIEQIIAEARKHHVLIGFDPNFHKMIWQPGEDGAAYVQSIIPQVDVIKPSKDDADRLFGEASTEQHLQRFLDLGARLVILTLGEEGALVSNGAETVKFETCATEVVDTTGAGDAFWSGFYTALVKGYSLREALKSGFAVSAYKLKYPGAIVELPALEYIREQYGMGKGGHIA